MRPRWKHPGTQMMTYFRRVMVALFSVLAAGCDATVGPRPGADQQLLFVSAPASGTQTDWGHLVEKDIYRMNADGTGLENLTDLPASSYGTLDLSPDGRTIVFYSTRGGCPAIWAMNPDGTDIRKLTTGDFADVRCNYKPFWSPDGSQIAFTTSREGTWAVYVMDADGSDPRNVSSPLDEVPGSTNFPAGWSPDGRVVFHQYSSDVRAYIVNPDGTDLGPLFGRTGDRSPAWSPDGSMVAFIRDMDDGRSSVFVMNADGSDVRRLTDQAGDDALMLAGRIDANEVSPWSPDGTLIAFVNKTDGGQAAIEVIRADGSGHLRLTEHGSETAFSGWSPDGRITFASQAAGSHDVYLINPDGSGLVRLTGSASHDRNALWLPRQ